MGLLWDVTLQSLSRQEVPSSSQNLVRSIQNEIEEAEKAIRTCRPVLLTMQDRVSEKQIAVNGFLARANNAIDESRFRLLSADSTPLWQVDWAKASRASFTESVRSFYSVRALPLFRYLKEYKSRLWMHLLLLALLVWLFTALSRGSREWMSPESRDGNADQVVRHPYAAALVISLLLSFSIYPNAPLTLYRWSMLLMVFPLLRVLSGKLQREDLGSVYFLAGFYLLRRLDGLFTSNDVLFRTYILLLTILAVAAAYWGARASRQALTTGIGPWRRARSLLLRLGIAFLLGSLIANIVGYVALATLLTQACISSAYAAAALFAGVLAVEGFLLPLSRSPLTRKSLSVRDHGDILRRHASRLIRFAAVMAWVAALLVSFGLLVPFLAWLSSELSRRWSFGKTTFSLGGIFLFVATIVLSIPAARLVAFFVDKDILSRMKLPQGIPATASMLVRDIIIAFGIILALAGAGVQWSQIALIASAIGVGVGLGLQNLVGSFVAGLILIIERPIRTGDIIEVDQITGVVSRIGLRSSTIQTFDHSEVICPNGNLISKELVNWTLSSQIRRVEVQVGVRHGSDPDAVLAALKRVAHEHPGVLQTPEPTALFHGFGEGSLVFCLRFFTPFGTYSRLRSEVGIRINKALQEAEIEIALHQRDIRVTGDAKQIPTG